MNSNFGKNFDFDLGLGSSRNKSLNDQKNKTSSYSSYSSSSAPSKPAWQPNKPSWTHQPAAAPSGQPARPGGLSGAPASMAGDIFGKTWTASNPAASGIGIVDKNPNLFGDLVNSALGQGKSGGSYSSSNVPLKNSTPAQSKSAFSMGNVADSLPKTGPNSTQVGGNWGPSMNYSGNVGGNVNRSPNLGGHAMNSGNVGGGIGGIGSKDPFDSLLKFGAKPSSNNLNAGAKNMKANSSNDVFGDFSTAPKPSASAFPISGNVFSGSTNPSPSFNFDNLVKPTTQAPTQSSSTSDPFDMFTSSNTTTAASDNGLNGLGGGLQSEMEDWGMEAEFGGDSGGPTTELDGLPPPPAGVNASAAKNKGMDNYKQGQYADAIKWLSWAVVLLEKASDNGTMIEVLSSRASCYKEVGEYKKAVADCTKVLEEDKKNVSVLVQRALLYESMEKYRLGAEDLRTVLKIDPGNRIARSTVHRLIKLAD